jgi:hypothetical protein
MCGWCFATCACTCCTEQAIDLVPVFVILVASMKLCHQQFLNFNFGFNPSYEILAVIL